MLADYPKDIYFVADHKIYVNLYISSTIKWKGDHSEVGNRLELLVHLIDEGLLSFHTKNSVMIVRSKKLQNVKSISRQIPD